MFTGSLLPVELINFTGQTNDEDVYLHWQTASEINNEYFIIEKSNNGEIFNEITKIESQGNATTVQHYDYTDRFAFSGINYYRLSQKDFDGQVQFLKTIAIDVEKKDATIITPNPFKHNLQIKLNLDLERKAQINIFDFNGKLIYSQEAKRDQNNIEILTNNWPQGTYSIQIVTPHQTTSRKIVKVN